jgi:hypothetical protein
MLQTCSFKTLNYIFAKGTLCEVKARKLPWKVALS